MLEQLPNVFGGERLDYLLRDLDVLDLHEGVGRDVVVAEEPGEEGACLSLPSPLRDGGDTGGPDVAEELVDICRLEPTRSGQVEVLNRLPEDLERLGVGPKCFWRLTLDTTRCDVEGKE